MPHIPEPPEGCSLGAYVNYLVNGRGISRLTELTLEESQRYTRLIAEDQQRRRQSRGLRSVDQPQGANPFKDEPNQ